MEVGQVRQEVERRLQEKEEEFDNTRKNFARAMDSMQASLDGEVKAKQEALREEKVVIINVISFRQHTQTGFDVMVSQSRASML
jgi:hypothetical protein